MDWSPGRGEVSSCKDPSSRSSGPPTIGEAASAASAIGGGTSRSSDYWSGIGAFRPRRQRLLLKGPLGPVDLKEALASVGYGGLRSP